jgi:DNA mismatch repair protein MutL
VHLIAAGEVIDSLAAVVRELVENALDAGATRITVSLEPDLWRVRVTDNGNGMSLDDLKSAANPHSTSKIQQPDDLWDITSLGFRGEALHSLAQLADLEIWSQPAEVDEGWRVKYLPTGEPEHIENVAIAPGTIAIAHDVFGRWLARRASLPSLTQQMRAIQTLVHQFALCHPHITWTVDQGDRPWFAVGASSNAKDILVQLLRDVQSSDLQELVVPVPDQTGESCRLDKPSAAQSLRPASQIHLLLGLPDRCHRYRPDWVRVAVNGRGVRSPELEQTVIGAFRRIIPRDRYPVCFVHLSVHPSQIDWNRHPAKTEIYLRDLELWRVRVAKAIDQALQLHPTSLSDTAYSQRVGQVLKAAESTGVYATSRTIQAPDLTSDSPDAAESQSESPLNPLRALAQVRNMYILAEHATGMWLVEQHIAHERVIYEQLGDRWQVIALETPIILSHLSSAQVEQLQRLELDVEPFGDTLWAVRTVPERLALRGDCADALLELSLGGNLEAALVATACRTAIRNGEPLNQDEMQTLLDAWQRTRNPHTCPHGRPIYLPLEESSLARFFRRHWVIGKSHGI